VPLADYTVSKALLSLVDGISALADLQLFLQGTLFIGHQMGNLCKISGKIA
jgi:hypothetical protein